MFVPRYISSLEESQSQHIEQLNNLKMSLKERSRVLHDARPHAECVPARDVIDRTDRTENSIEVSDILINLVTKSVSCYCV